MSNTDSVIADRAEFTAPQSSVAGIREELERERRNGEI